MSECNCNSAPGQHRDDWDYHADNCPVYFRGRIAALEAEAKASDMAALFDIVQREVEGLRKQVQRLEEGRRWIPCSERLPKPWEFVLVWVDYQGGTPYHTIDRYDDGDDDGPVWEESTSKYMNITHWMPLPQPPTGGEGE